MIIQIALGIVLGAVILFFLYLALSILAEIIG